MLDEVTFHFHFLLGTFSYMFLWNELEAIPTVIRQYLLSSQSILMLYEVKFSLSLLLLTQKALPSEPSAQLVLQHTSVFYSFHSRNFIMWNFPKDCYILIRTSE